MATLVQKIAAEVKIRQLLEANGLPAPNAVEYGYTCIRLYWKESKVVLVIDIDEFPTEWEDEPVGVDLSNDTLLGNEEDAT